VSTRRPPTLPGRRRLVGREHVLGVAHEHLLGGGSVVLVGRHGSGRTRLLGELQRRHPGPSLALRPGPATADLPLGVLVAELPELDGVLEHLLGEARRAVVERLRALADGRRLLVTVDDAEHLDATTAAGLCELVDGLPWCGLAAATVPAAAYDPRLPTGAHPGVRVLDVGPLGAAEVRALASDELGGPVDGSLAAELTRRSAGVPAAVLELVRGARETGALDFDGEVWRGQAPLPLHRLAAFGASGRSGGGELAPELREMLEVLALAGPLPERVVAALTSAECLRGLLDTRRVVWTAVAAGRQLSVGDPLDAEVVRAGLDADGRRQRLARLLGAVARAGGAPLEPLRVARWWLELGGGEPTLLEDGARQAYAAGDYRLAGRLAEAAIARGGGARATMAAGAAAVEVGRSEEGERLLTLAIAAASTEAERAWATIALAHARGVRGGCWDQARDLLVTRHDELTDPVVRLDVEAYRTLLAAVEGRVEAARSGLRSLLARGHGAEVSSDRAVLLLGAAAALLVEEAPAAPEVHAALAGAGDVDPAAHPALPLGPELVRAAALDPPSPDARLAAVRTELAAALARDHGDEAAWWSLAAGRAALVVGRVGDAEVHLGEAARGFDRVDSLGLRSMAVVHLARARALGGASEGARRLLGTLAAGGCRSARTATWAAVTTAVIAAGGGGPDAVALARRAGWRAAEEGRWDAVQVAAESLLTSGDGRRAGELLAAVTDHVPSTQIAVVHDAAVALAEGSSTGLEAAARRLAAVGRRLLAAELAGHAVARGAGPPARALCRGLATTCDVAWLPTTGRIEPVVLPPRGRTVARAVAAGHTTGRIAADLGVSPRTVEHHLGRVYRDLGVSGRRELAAVYPAQAPPLTMT
jgi:DNA-binding CsgD family transcriptional regulator